MKRKILVTSALPYSNGDIHLGHLLEYLQTDFWVRFQKMQKNECLYFCADDTHGTPMMIKAKKENVSVEELIDKMSKKHIQDFNDFEINFTHYSSTNSNINKEVCFLLYEFMKKGNHITKEVIEQYFCNQCNMFLPDRFVKGNCPKCNALDQNGDSCEKCGNTYKPEDMENATCVQCNNSPNLKKSEHLFFQLNNFKEVLKEWILFNDNDQINNKLKEWLNDDLKAWDISRDAPYFGFEIPEEKNKYFYVWIDAPIGYIATTEEWCKQENNGKSWKDYWKNNDYEIYHFIGKDIIYFHCLFWPAMLKSADLSLPKKVIVHGFLTLKGEKMSKSKGTFVTARKYLDHLHPQYLRYYFASKLSNNTNDIDLNLVDFCNRINSELIGKITNLASRGFQMLHKKLDGKLGTLTEKGQELVKESQEKSSLIKDYYENCDFLKVIVEIRQLAENSNRYFDTVKPWEIKDNPEYLQSILTDCLNLFRIITIYLAPIMPSYCEKVSHLFKESSYLWEDIHKTLENKEILPYEYLAERVDNEVVNKLLGS